MLSFTPADGPEYAHVCVPDAPVSQAVSVVRLVSTSAVDVVVHQPVTPSTTGR
jgi:hypothetical protein